MNSHQYLRLEAIYTGEQWGPDVVLQLRLVWPGHMAGQDQWPLDICTLQSENMLLAWLLWGRSQGSIWIEIVPTMKALQ